MSTVFRAMNTDVTLVAPTLEPDDERRLSGGVAKLFEQSERVFSRFRDDSELSRLNRAGRLRSASPLLFEALRRALDYAELTGGWFNPAICGALVAAGYDRSFEPGRLDRSTAARCVEPVGDLGGIRLDPARRSIELPPGMRLDFGGFIKGWTLDRSAALLPCPAALEAGGDVVLRGAGPAGDGWLVDVEDPADARRELATLRVHDGAVATSAPNRRRWRTGDGEQHHLIDPSTGRPADSDLAQVSVLAPRAEQADVLAKTTFLLGARDGRRFLERRPGIGALLVRPGGQFELVGRAELDHAA